ncbi:hypothetical protein ACFE04_018344 [Oxalis oulophora]
MSCFFFFFGWRKAAKCKRMIKKARCRLKLLINKRSSIVKHLRQDVALLIKNGHQQSAFKRAEHLYKDESMMSAYQLLDNFCEFITSNLSTIRKKREFPDDITEAISTLIYASARCGDLPEFREIRNLFGERFGQSFADTAVELLPGNLVNDQVKDKLSVVYSVPDHVTHNLVTEIAKNHGLQLEMLAIEYASELQQQTTTPQFDCIDLAYGDGSLSSNNNSVTTYHCDSASITDQKSLKDKTELQIAILSTSGMNTTNENLEIRTMQKSTVGNKKRGSSSESLPRVSDDKIVYIDDIEEIQSPIVEDAESRDKRSFKFINKSTTNSEKFNNYAAEALSKKDVEFLRYYEKSRKGINNSKNRQSPHKDDKIGSETRTFSRKQSQRKSSGNSTPVYPVFTYKDGIKPNMQQVGPRNERDVPPAPYTRAMTMPLERKQEDREKNIVRACSLPAENLNHVHPKLPDCDDLKAKFTALKQEHLHHINNSNQDGKV